MELSVRIELLPCITIIERTNSRNDILVSAYIITTKLTSRDFKFVVPISIMHSSFIFVPELTFHFAL